ncbi:hypothetical protein FB567DRAFT_299669 [Paraphoma chrysanthemicola]|uniref:Uncharacterized protein n=1 Tax=Paraphoma chrysanthemicola TaxID=798071 RepID=A0A8K0W0V7_9PLEO|nr:hypothetical protein FB567DRAFT_299669 [Paraphoma chrysanthemicola]
MENINFDTIVSGLATAKERLVTNSIKSFEGMTTQRWIRLIAIVGAYLLIRPYILQGAANRRKAALEKEQDELGLGADTGPDANSLRGVKKGPGKVLGEVKDDTPGSKASARQRKTVDGVR